MSTSKYGKTDIVKLLVDRGADIDAKDNSGKTAMMLSKEMGHEDILRLLEKASRNY